MRMTQWYVGAPNGVVVCVDAGIRGHMAGRFYQSYSRDAAEFANEEQLLFGMERFFDSINFPRQSTAGRTFRPEDKRPASGEERRRIMSDKELLSRHGDLGTFIVRVQHRQNSSWQGRVTWMEKNQTLSFRSIWELLKLMASAVGTAAGPEEDEPEAHWDEG